MDPYPYFLEDRHTTTWPSELLCYYHFNQKKEGDTEDKDAGIVEEEEEAAQEEEKWGLKHLHVAEIVRFYCSICFAHRVKFNKFLLRNFGISQ